MDEIDIACELALMYTVSCGVINLMEMRGEKVRNVSTLESNAVSCGMCFLRDETEKLWDAISRLI